MEAKGQKDGILVRKDRKIGRQDNLGKGKKIRRPVQEVQYSNKESRKREQRAQREGNNSGNNSGKYSSLQIERAY